MPRRIPGLQPYEPAYYSLPSLIACKGQLKYNLPNCTTRGRATAAGIEVFMDNDVAIFLDLDNVLIGAVEANLTFDINLVLEPIL